MTTTRQVLSLLLTFGSFAIGNSLDCTTCHSDISWDDCEKNAKTQTCTLAGVNAQHAILGPLYNPNLVQGTAQDEFQCFTVEAVLKDPAADESPKAFSRDCTFKKVDFCKGWLDRVQVVKCETSSSGVLAGGSGGLIAVGALVVARFLGGFSAM